MIPAFVDIGAPWRVLPPGIHNGSLQDVKNCFATNPRRKWLYNGLMRGCESLKLAGCRVVYLDGSYVTSKPTPGDFDLCWDPTGLAASQIDPVLLDFTNGRKRQKLKYGGEFFPSSALADGSNTFLEFFKIDKYTGKEKGLVRVIL